MLSIFNVKSGRRNSGFTIIELVIVIGIFGMLSTLAIFNFNRQLKSAHLKQVTQKFVSFVNVSKSESLTSGSPCVLIFNHNEAKITISNPVECTMKATSKLLNDSNHLQNLAICGTNNTSFINMLCDQENDGSDVDTNGTLKTSTRIEFTPKGTVSKGALVKIYSSDIKLGYCIIITEPVGLIRTTRMNGNICNFAV